VVAGAPVSVAHSGATLGEGPVWIARDAALWFVDIKRQQIHRFDPATGAFSLLVAVEADLPGNRLNDAATDPKGRIWFGSMDDKEAAATGRFYRYADGRVTDAGLPPVSITNGPAFSPDGRLIYFTDTLGKVIHVGDVSDDGQVTDARPFVSFGADDGHPDGPTVDAEGCLWTGLFGGWEARRYAPSGELLERVRFPVANVTKLAFGGSDLRTVYATTARLHLTPEALETQVEAGNLFAFRADVPGVAVTAAAL
jgi:sugar lactone lactonase YvrE